MKQNNTTVWIIVAFVVLIVFFVMPWSGQWGGFCGMMGQYDGYNGMMQWFGFGWIFMFVILVALILLIVWLVQQVQRAPFQNSKGR